MSVDPDANADIEADAAGDAEININESADISTADTMRGRATENRGKLWIAFGANRLLVTGLLALGFFVVFVVAGELFIPVFESTIRSDGMINLLFSTMITAIITATTLVVTISQLVIAQENGPLGEQRERMSNTMDFRDYTEEMIGAPSPPDPSAFLGEIINTTEQQADRLHSAIADNGDPQLRAEVNQFTNSLTGNAQAVQQQLNGAEFGSFDTLFAALNYNYGNKIFQIERIANDHDDSLTNEDRAILKELKSTLSMFGPARQHIKTLYFESALIDLSQLILYASVPALLVAGWTLVFVGGSSFSGTTVGIHDTILVIGMALTITLIPFFLLVSYIARILVVVERTLAIGPLILRESER